MLHHHTDEIGSSNPRRRRLSHGQIHKTACPPPLAFSMLRSSRLAQQSDDGTFRAVQAGLRSRRRDYGGRGSRKSNRVIWRAYGSMRIGCSNTMQSDLSAPPFYSSLLSAPCHPSLRRRVARLLSRPAGARHADVHRRSRSCRRGRRHRRHWTREKDGSARSDTVMSGNVLVRYGLTDTSKYRPAGMASAECAIRDTAAGLSERDDGRGDVSFALRQKPSQPR